MNSDKKGLVPRLRFPEFEGEWSSQNLSSVLEEHGRKDDGHSEVYSVSVHKGVVNQREHLGRSFAAADTSNYNLVGPSDVVYTKSPTGDFPLGIVKQNKSNRTVIVSPLYGVFQPVNESVGTLLDSFFESPERTRRFLDSLVQKGAKNTIQISNSTFLSKGIPLPREEAEQQKIAACLSSLDDLIAAEVQKLDALKTHKKGLLQQLFPREGETVPRLRFPEFRGAGEWKVVQAGTLFANRVERGTPDLPIYSVTMTDGMVPRASMDRKIDDLVDSTGNKLVRTGDLAYNMMRMWQGAVGVAVEDCMVSPAYIVLAPNDADPWFFYYLWKLPLSLRRLTAHSRGLTEDRLRLYYDDFSKMSVRAPSLPEQLRIGTFLFSLDERITAQSQKIDALKTHKKGLMQQLFPAITEDTD